jgi:3-dehydroquinate synthase
MKKIIIKVDLKNNNYPIIIGNHLLLNAGSEIKKIIPKAEKFLLITDKNIPKSYARSILSSLKSKKKYLLTLAAGEKSKNMNFTNTIIKKLFKYNFNRDDCVIALGGGVIGDLSGFAGSIFKRGLNLVQIPTTLLAQVDSSIGGKTGINSEEGKNMIGTFYQPKLVLIDPTTLKSLPRRHLIAGYAEILKYALIMNSKFFTWLEKNSHAILNLSDLNTVMYAIKESCTSKAIIVQKDEKEKNLRAILNFGHTFAHAFEASKKYSEELIHGEAVLYGMMIASSLSVKMKMMHVNEYQRIRHLYQRLNINYQIKNLFKKSDVSKILDYMKHDKKVSGSKINLILLSKIGKAKIHPSDLNKNIKPILIEQFN